MRHVCFGADRPSYSHLIRHFVPVCLVIFHTHAALSFLPHTRPTHPRPILDQLFLSGLLELY